MKTTRWYIIRLLLLTGGLVLVFSSFWLSRSSLPVWELSDTLWRVSQFSGLLFLIWIFSLLLFLAQAFVHLLLARGRTDPLLKEMGRKGIGRTLLQIALRRSFPEARYAVMASVWSGVIMILISLIRQNGTLDDVELRLRWSSPAYTPADSAAVPRVLIYTTSDNNKVRYLRGLLEITRQCRDAGARVIVAEVPSGSPSPAAQEYIDSIRAITGVIVHSKAQRLNARYPPRTSSQRVPVYRTVLSASDPASAGGRTLLRWFPCTQEEGRIEHEIDIDVALRAVGGYLGYPDTLLPECREHEVIYGSLHIPVGSNGEAYTSQPNFISLNGLPGFVALPEASDSLLYVTSEPRRGNSPNFPESLSHEVQGKIIWIAWVDDQFPKECAAYVTLIGNLHRQEFVRVEAVAPYLLSLAGLAICALLAWKFRPFLAVVTMLFLGAVFLFSGVWIFAAQNILLYTAYPALATALAAGVFPLLRIANTNS
jgi:hypothetical protein